MLNERLCSVIDLTKGLFIQLRRFTSVLFGVRIPCRALTESYPPPPPCDNECLKQNNYLKNKPKAALSKAAA
jgi:hypothetical protein